jgi:hypothetical protein
MTITREEKQKEIVICSAIKFSEDLIIRGHRHSDCFYSAVRFYGENNPNAEQGFMTSQNRFVGRKEGLKLQLLAGIKSENPQGYDKKMLFSEDLY